MKKVSIFLGAVFCIFILCSVIYQPIVAGENIDVMIKKHDCDCCAFLTIMFRLLTKIGSIYIKITGEQPPETFRSLLGVVINGLDTFNCDFNNRINIIDFF